MASSELSYYCHSCNAHVQPITEDIICPRCEGGFVEKMENNPESNEPTVENTDGSPNVEGQNQFSEMPAGFDFFFPRNDANAPFPNAFAWNFSSNNRNGPSTSRNETTSSTAPYNLRQRPHRVVGSSNSAPGLRRGPVPVEHVFDVVRRVFEGVDSPFIEFSLGGGGGNFPPAFNFMELHGNTGDYAWGPNGLDNIISQLLGQLENAGPPPASENAIKNLPTISIAQEDVDKGRECSVCMEHFKLDEKAKRLPCTHFFHIPCIDPWLELHNTCPICRKVVEDVSCGSQTSSNNTGDLGQNTQNADSPSSNSSNNPNPNTDQGNSFFSLFSNVFSPRSNNQDPH